MEDGVVGADAHVADGQEGNHLDGAVAVVALTSLKKQILMQITLGEKSGRKTKSYTPG